MESKKRQSKNSKATRIDLFNFSTPQMRAFHMSWFAFFLCFFAWFGIVPLMTIVREEFALTKEQMGWCIIGSVSATVAARLVIGWLCDHVGPRLAYTWLLIIGALPVMGIGLAWNFESFLVFRILIGGIGASFVITQYHTSSMFSSRCIGTANATTAGWGNMGGGATQIVMPYLFLGLITCFGLSEQSSWRIAMVIAGLLCMLTGVAYFFLTQDSPEGNFKELKEQGLLESSQANQGTFLSACQDSRVWSLFIIYGACFGMELIITNVAALYFIDYFDEFKKMETMQALKIAGLFAALFGLMNIFARTLGGGLGDFFGNKFGLKGRLKWLFIVLFCEGLTLMLFSQMSLLVLAIPTLILFSLCVKMAQGATFSVVPFVNKKATGAVAGIVGAGGNMGAVAAGFLFKGELDWGTAFFILGAIVTVSSFLAFAIKFNTEAETDITQQKIKLATATNG
ncbi:Nitrate/nitrite transporter [hydrothermal vent metagenome]|uniref:Nitrate/nitrite transporter n=1 Tax=hydrothermal vent metagenome TaxID=652676 RepID=A0A3B1DYT2_9ZZZZ